MRDWINSGAFQASRALPVVLTDFSAYNEEDKKVVLYWQTSSEYNTAFFEIENSGDGIQFNTIGKKQASSNPNVLTNYEFTDLTPGFGNQSVSYTHLSSTYECNGYHLTNTRHRYCKLIVFK